MLALTNTTCFLCNSEVETIDHLMLECPITVLCWSRSPWQICITHFKEGGISKWIQLLLDEGNMFPLEPEEKQKMLHFAIIMFEQIWLWRNKIRLGAMMSDWNEMAVQVARLLHSY